MDNKLTMPLAGPSTFEEAIARIQEAETEIDNNGGHAWDEVMAEARQRVEIYAAAV